MDTCYRVYLVRMSPEKKKFLLNRCTDQIKKNIPIDKWYSNYHWEANQTKYKNEKKKNEEDTPMFL